MTMPAVPVPRMLFGLIVALYVLSFPYHPKLRSPNELCRLWQSRSLVDHGSLSINDTIREFGMVGDLSVVDQTTAPFNQRGTPKPGDEKLYYPSKAPLLSFVAAPIYAVQKLFGRVSDTAQVFWGRLFLTILPTLVMLVFLRRFLLTYLPPLFTDAIIATYALGTMAFNYSEMFLSHQVTAVLLFFAFYAAWRTLEGQWQRWGWVVSGAFAGAVVATEYTGALGVLCLAIYVGYALVKREPTLQAGAIATAKAAGQVLLGSAPFLAGLMLYHYECFGDPLKSGYKFLNDPGYQPWHMGGFLGIHYPDPRAFWLSFFSPLRGLFTLSPFLLLTFLGLKTLYRDQRALFVLTVALLLGNAYFTSSFTYDSWGWAVGPRHMTPLIPFMLLPAGFALKALSEGKTFDQRIGFAIAIGMCVGSIVMDGSLSFINYVTPAVSTSFWTLAVPLFEQGYLPASSLLFIGIANPISGALLLLLLAAAAGVVFWMLSQGHGRAVAAFAVLALLTHLLLLKAFTRYDNADIGTVAFMKDIWIAPPGVSLLH